MSSAQPKNALSVLASNYDYYCQQAKEIMNRSEQSGVISIGLELEIFLRDSHHKLVQLEQSQEFLQKLSDLPRWKIYQKNEESHYITRVSCELPNGKYHSVKYEHPPHLIELALSYFDNLLDLKDHLHAAMEDMHQAAKNAGLILDIKSNAEATQLEWSEINKIESRFEKLSQSRKRIFAHFNHEECSDQKLNFTTYTAATQYHIGGIKWWNLHDAFMNNVHLNEFLIGANAYDDPKEFKTRWDSYRYVFNQMKLLGFPKIETWSFDNWVDAMVRDNPFEDPATHDLDLIISQAALRLGSYLNAMKSEYKTPLHGMRFQELSKIWHKGEHVGNSFSKESEQLKEQVWNALRERGKNEEGLL